MLCRIRSVGCALLLALVLGPLSTVAHGEGARSKADLPSLVFAGRASPGFLVLRDDVRLGFFAEVSGIGSETEVTEFRDGGDTGPARKLPGRTRYPDITLKRGITSNLDLWDWREEVVSGALARSTVTVILVGARGQPQARWTFVNAWPSKISGPQFDADGHDIAIETITITHEGMNRVQ